MRIALGETGQTDPLQRLEAARLRLIRRQLPATQGVASAVTAPTIRVSPMPWSIGPWNACWKPLRLNHCGPWPNSRGLKATSRNSTMGSSRIAATTSQKSAKGALRAHPAAFRKRKAAGFVVDRAMSKGASLLVRLGPGAT
jgi:hypothetical protein